MTARVFALFVALLPIMNLLGDWLWPGFDASIWWISLGTLPAWLSQFLLELSAFALFVFACREAKTCTRCPSPSLSGVVNAGSLSPLAPVPVLPS